MSLLLAAYADVVIMAALQRYIPIALAMVSFGVVYWLFRRRVAARETQKRREWLKDRRARRVAGKPTPPKA